MPHVEFTLKQASAVLRVPQKDLRNLVQACVLKPRCRLGLDHFDVNLLLQARVVIYLREALGASTRYLSKFTAAVATLPEFESGTPAVVSLKARSRQTEPAIEIRIPLGALAEDLRQRLPLAATAGDLRQGRTRPGWKRDFLAAVRKAAGDLGDLSEKQLAVTIRAYRRERGRSGLTVVAEAAKASA